MALLTDRNVAEMLSMSATTLAKWRTEPWRSRYKLPFVRVGRKIRYDAAAVQRWLEQRSIGGEATATPAPRRRRLRRVA